MEELVVLGTLLVIVVVMALSTVSVYRHVYVDVEIAEIEQLRKDCRTLDIRTEGLIEKIVTANMRIKRNQAANKHKLRGLMVPNKWDDVETIDMTMERWNQ